jgi:hypothetical protein
MGNLERITEEYEKLKGQLVLCDFKVYRFIGICDDQEDWYYCLYDGRKLNFTSCVIHITPLKGFIDEWDYNWMVSMCKGNHYDQPILYGTKDDISKFNEGHKTELLSKLDENTKFVLGPHWDLN